MIMLKRMNLHPYQETAIKHILNNPEAGLFLDMGLGKTISTLTAVKDLLYDYFDVGRVLVIAPLRVARTTWVNEINEWEHVNDLTISVITGTAKQRTTALSTKADIYTINRENVVWLVETLGSDWDFDMVVVDELSSFKANRSKRFRALRKVRPLIKRIVGLTGTPAPNGLLDLWPQMYLLDGGKALGKTITGYRNRYFYPVKMNGPIVYEYGLRDGSKEAIEKRIANTCISMKAEDYLAMPDYINNTIQVEMSTTLMKQYKIFQREKVLELEESEIVGVNAGAMFNKLLQFSNGAVYDENKNHNEIHQLKLKALESVILEAMEQPVMCFYNFKHDLNRIKEHFKDLKPRTLDTTQDERDWNTGKIKLLLAHPASMGHGLNLQKGGHIIVWFGLTCSLELYQQANARLYRQGQSNKSVIIHHLVTTGTFDELVMKKLKNKEMSQSALLEALKSR